MPFYPYFFLSTLTAAAVVFPFVIGSTAPEYFQHPEIFVPPPVFQWRWSIPLIAVFLLFADYMYFYALSIPDSMISIISVLRRGGVLVAFTLGAVLFKEKNIKRKGIYLLGILIGILIISFGSK